MRHVSRAAFHLAEWRIAAIASSVEVREGTVMARYFAFLVFGCAFSVCAAAMVETHLQVSNPAPQVVANRSAH
jgi:hypothetical protein